MAFVRKAIIFTGLKTLNSGLGFALSLLVAVVFGANEITDALFIAMFLPVEMARMASGRLPVVLVPILTEHRLKHGEDLAPYFLGWWIICLILLALILVVTAPGLVRLMAPGLGATARATAEQLLMILSPSLVMFGLFSYGMSLFYLDRHFLVPELAQLAWRVTALAALFLAGRVYGVYGYVAGLVLAAFVQLSFLILPDRSAGNRFISIKKPSFNWVPFRPILAGGLVVVVALLFNRSTVLVDRLFASFLGTGSISLLFYADRLARALPLLLATSIFTLYLPELSSAKAKSGSMDGFRRELSLSLMILGLPIAVLLFWSADDLVNLLLVYGRFSEDQTGPIAFAIRFYSLGIPAIICSTGLRSTFLVERDWKEVIRFGLITLVLTVVLDFILYRLGLRGLALASSITVWIVFLILWSRLNLEFPELKLCVIIFSSVSIMAAFLFIPPWKTWISVPFIRLLLGTTGATVIYIVTVSPVHKMVKGRIKN